jgi:hypothetical protein
MKPLLGGNQTPEDRAIWLRMADRYIWKPGAYGITSYIYRDSDRRDAELMLGIERARRYEREHPEDFAQYSGMGFVNTLVSVALEDGPIGFQGLGITYFA